MFYFFISTISYMFPHAKINIQEDTHDSLSYRECLYMYIFLKIIKNYSNETFFPIPESKRKGKENLLLCLCQNQSSVLKCDRNIMSWYEWWFELAFIWCVWILSLGWMIFPSVQKKTRNWFALNLFSEWIQSTFTSDVSQFH